MLEVCVKIKKKNTNLKHPGVDNIALNKPRDISEAFSNHFQSVYSNSVLEPFLLLINALKSYMYQSI
jgi:hypothetical protein